MANSINTNYGANIALQNLNATNRALETTQNRINTGKAVNSAKDNGAIWSIAQNQTTQMNALDAVKQSLQRGQSTIDVAMAAGETVKDVLGQMKNLVLAASDPGVDEASLQAYEDDFKNLAKQIETTVKGASFNGVNMLAGATAADPGKSLKALASADGKNTINVDGVNFALQATGGTSKASINFDADAFATARTAAAGTPAGADPVANPAVDADPDAWSDLMTQVDDSIAYVTSSLTKLGTGSKSLDNQLTFTSKLQDTLETGIGNLVDADLAKESAKLTALQTKQQLGVQALSIANQSSSILLSLFR